MNFNNFSKKHFLVVGDIILDNYVSGTCSRISQEAPVPVVLSKKEICVLGGAANVVANLRSIGCEASIAGLVGNDYFGQNIVSMLNSIDVSDHNIIKCNNVPTIVKTRIIANDQHVVRYDRESSFLNVPETVLFENEIQKLLSRQKFDAIIISDYNKGTITQSLMYILKSFNIPILVDPKPNNSFLYQGCDCVSPNLQEACQMSGMINDKEAAKYIKKILDIKSVIITLSENGVMLLDKDDNIFNVNSYHLHKDERHHRIDVVGAGDTLISVYAAAVFSGFTQLESIILSNMAASIVVNKLGTATCSLEELKKESIHLDEIVNNISNKS